MRSRIRRACEFRSKINLEQFLAAEGVAGPADLLHHVLKIIEQLGILILVLAWLFCTLFFSPFEHCHESIKLCLGGDLHEGIELRNVESVWVTLSVHNMQL